MEDKKYFEGLGRKFSQEDLDRMKDARQRRFLEDRAKLKASDPIIKDRSLSREETPKLTKGESFREKIDRLTKKMPEGDTIDYGQFRKKAQNVSGDTLDYSKLRKQMQDMGKRAGRSGLRAFPLIGGLMAAAQSGDASAAVPILGDAESAGMSSAEEDIFIAEQEALGNYAKSQAYRDRMAALERLGRK